MAELKQVTIGKIIDEKYDFIIPSNQRGYRWEKQQIEELLEDILAFKNSGHKQNEFYCLQPLVLQKAGSKKYNVVDGQQRLTTLFIIISYVKNNYSAARIMKDLYSIQYDTRQVSGDFLDKIYPLGKDNHTKNVDSFYMYNAAKEIHHWFEKYASDCNFAMSFYSEIEKSVQFIWYEIDPIDNAHDVFARINCGKIPLTNSELIKAVLLNKNNFPISEQFQMQKIASEWNNIELFFANDDFWYFIADEDILTTRIDLLFELFNKQNKSENDFNYYKIFNNFLLIFNNSLIGNKNDRNKTVNEIWDKISECYENFKEWYLNNTLFHKIGFLISSGKPLSKLSNDLAGKKKDEIDVILRELIRDTLNLTEKKFYELEYDNRKELRKLFLLFNIETIVKGEQNTRFSFEKYKKYKWDIEHIHAKVDEGPNKSEEIKSWWKTLKDNWVYLKNAFTNHDLLEFKELVALIDKEDSAETLSKDTNLFKKYYSFILNTFSEGFGDNVLGNLTLLNSDINRAYKNAVFAVKRRTIIEEDAKGKFIPPCTKNVFLKYYSNNAENMFCWSANDQKDYAGTTESVGAIYSIVKEYLK